MVHYEDNTGTERVEKVTRVLPGRSSVLNLSPKVDNYHSIDSYILLIVII